MRIRFFVFLWAALLIVGSSPVFADTSSQILREQDQQQEHDSLYDNFLTTPRPSTIETAPKLKENKRTPPTTIFIKSIVVQGYTVISSYNIFEITSKFENRQLTIHDFRTIIGQLDALYTQKGYITSFAYLPPQHFSQDTLIINVFEGKIGKIKINGNHYFSNKTINRYLTFEPNQILNYYPLKSNLDYLNRNPDRYAKATIESGTAPGTSDININVHDQFPIHFKYDYDNEGSKYIGHNEYHTSIWDTNFLGLDHTASYGYTTSPDHELVAWNLGYSLPIGLNDTLNFTAQHSQTHLGANLKPLEVYGKSTTYTGTWTRILLQTQTWTAHANLGFAYKNNYDLFLETYFDRGRDDLREITYGGDINHLDPLGRTYFNAAILTGIPDFLGGLKYKDPQATVLGSGGQFTKATLDLIRLQKLPFNTVLIWNTETQQSSATLPSAEQFQAGGITNNRGYPAGDLVGDAGYSSSWNLAIPLYPIPRDWMIPFTKSTIYNSIKLVPFYDWARVVTYKPSAGTKKDGDLRSVGVGLQGNVSKYVSWKIEYAWPLGQPATDQKKSRLLTSLSVSF